MFLLLFWSECRDSNPKQYGTACQLLAANDYNTRGLGFSQKFAKKDSETADAISESLVGVSGFEPEASWTRTKRDTKLRHTPITTIL